MVRALLDGSKTQTRRIVKLGREFGPSSTPGYDWTFRGTRRGGVKGAGAGCWQDYRNTDLLQLCPYGVAGDRLWVRETWAKVVFSGSDWEQPHIMDCVRPAGPDEGGVVYRADDHGLDDGGNTTEERGFAWRPSIFMPRWASRITLEITELRAERLQDISDADAKAEGAPWEDCWPTYRQSFEALWDSINGAGDFELNKWVWVIRTEKVRQ